MCVEQTLGHKLCGYGFEHGKVTLRGLTPNSQRAPVKLVSALASSRSARLRKRLKLARWPAPAPLPRS